ncbi:unnamed protein product [Ilex paraguariensis]|uniref:Uncharacterized protein n=1 Tax=Ilex paraguariensis TaxID=185542 RepID=A0ABC8UTU5_9AQUA
MMRNRTNGGAAASFWQGADDSDLMQTMREIARVMSQSEGNGMNTMITLKEFRGQNPPMFNGRHASTIVPDDDSRARRFEWSLRPTIRGRVMVLCLPTYAIVVEAALVAERELDDTTQIKESSPRSRDSRSRAGSGKRQRTSTPQSQGDQT